MLFTSYEFLAFAAVLLLLYYLVPRRAQWGVLLAFSLVFYALAGRGVILYLLFVAFSAYLVARLMAREIVREGAELEAHKEEWGRDERKAFKARAKKKRFRLLLLGLFCELGLLCVLKYTGFFVTNFNDLLHYFGASGEIPVPRLLLPMGISFYIFQTASYLIDVYRERAQAQRNPLRFLLFVSYFPQLVQGPISRYNDLGGQLTEGHELSSQNLVWGLERVLFGYFKKLVVADRVLIVISTLLSDTETYKGVYVLLLILLYTVEIYADFTGGIDITIGLSEALGIRMAENFKRPFLSTSTKEYWNRWHITMGTWFTDYVFYPLSVSRPMQKLSKWGRAHLGVACGKRLPVYIATIVTWFLTGLWHGAGWNFIVWGLLNCLVILVSQEMQPFYDRFYKRFPKFSKSGGFHVFRVVRTVLLMGLIRSLDCYRNVPLTFRLWGSMFTTSNYGQLFDGSLLQLGLGGRDWILLLAATAVMFGISLWGVRRPVRERLWEHRNVGAVLTVAMLVAVLVFGAYGIGFDANQFIYNQF